jgi:DNA-binding beta-propeller fold protein YncE
MGVAVAADGGVVVADTGHNRIVKLSADGALVASWGDQGQDDTLQLRNPEGVALGPDGSIFVADTGNDRIVKLGPAGDNLGAFGAPGIGPGEFRDPHSVAVDGESNVFVADTLNHRIQKLGASGEPLAQWGFVGGGPRQDAYETSLGRGIGQFRFPKGVALDSGGNLFVADSDNFRIVKLSSTSGEFLAQWIGLGSVIKNKQVPGSFQSPRGVAVDAAGTLVYVADTFNHWVQRLSADGRPQAHWGGQGTAPGEFSFPSGIAVDAQGNVYVADTYNDRIQRLAVSP